MKNIILASASPRRREILSNAGVSFDIKVADVDESMEAGITPELAVQQLAMKKAVAVSRKTQGEAYIVAADTVVCIGSKILGKPKSEEEAFEMLCALRGRAHEVKTGVCVIQMPSLHTATFCESTKVFFKNVSDEQIKSYIKSGEPMDKAGAYGIQGEGEFLVEKYEGDFLNVVGLPLSALKEFFEKEFNIELV